ncbi:Rad17-domain-containing protein [Lojkania enalia]|uniref:Rad17-domain-containing protein n=1 Tax=Lojkania enalia TaxID=147567 RepID=A0A9P4NCC9_9PLEO|nr:Rad17-domain-containing protein [Didymosphaeria enalia]
MGKPRAARKQPIVLSSDDEYDGQNSPPPKRPRRGTLMSIPHNGARGQSHSSRAQTRRAGAPTRSPSIASHKSPSKSPAKPKAVYKPITSFFSNVPRPSTSQPTPSPEKPATSIPLDEEDDILDSEAELPVKSTTGKAQPTAPLAAPLRGSQRFLHSANGGRRTPPLSQTARADVVDNRPWNEKYGPATLDELAVHKKKVSDVRTWLSDVYNGRERKRLLLLKGPAGSGKTTSVILLSKELGIEVHEWKNPTALTSYSEGFVSLTAQFQDFVGRTGAFGSLAFDESAPIHHTHPTSSPSSRQKQLILVEEFPNTFTRASSTVQSFRSSILHYLAANIPPATAFFSGKPDPQQSITPIVMIISETLLSTNTAAADSFTAHRLLGPEILTHPGVSTIEFNPIAQTFMTKALELVVLKESRKSGRRKTPGPQVIQRLSEIGDVRSAVSSLEFLCLRGDEDDGWGAKVTFTKKKGPKDIPLTRMEQESLEMVTQRESTLGIFHAVGKVVHNKRLPENPNGNTYPQPPNWFPERRRPKQSEVQIDPLIDELGTDTQTFIAALHENYILSCEGAYNEETMDSIDGCIDALSDADLLSPDRFGKIGFGRRDFTGTGADHLRQDEMSFQVSVRGLLYSLPSPVKRIAPPPGSAYVMYYPTSLRLWKQQEEIGGLLDLWISRVQKGELLAPGVGLLKPSETRVGSVDTWRTSASFPQPSKSSPTQAGSSRPSEDDAQPLVILGSGGSARYEMLLERLPYLPIILRKSSMASSSTTSMIRAIQKITAFTGTGISASTEDDQDDDNELVEQEQWATDKPGSATPRKKRRVGIEKKTAKESEALETIMEKNVANMVLSDDDIED